MGMIYRRTVFDPRPIDPKDPKCKRRLPCEDEKHGQAAMCPACASRFGKTWWIKFYRAGKPFFESSRSTKKRTAEDLLKVAQHACIVRNNPNHARSRSTGTSYRFTTPHTSNVCRI